MRNKLLTKIAAISLGLAMAIGVSVGVANNNKKAEPVYATLSNVASASLSDDCTHSNTGIPTSGESGWTVSVAPGSYESASYARGWQFGSGADPVFTFHSSGVDFGKVTITASSNANAGNVTLSVSVGGTAWSPASTSVSVGTANANSTYAFTGENSGNVVVTVTNSNANKTTWIKNIEIYAIDNGGGDPASYTVSFNGNGAEGNMSDVEDVSGSYTLPDNEFTVPSGKMFAGWKADNAGNIIAAGASYNVNADVTFYAQWSNIQYTVTYHDDYKTGGAAPYSASYEDGTVVTIQKNSGSLVRTGYEWFGWSLNEDGTGTAYGPFGPGFTATYTINGSNVDFYPIWVANPSLPSYDEELAFHFAGSSVHGSNTSYAARNATVDTETESKYNSAAWQITVGNNSAQLGTNANANKLSLTTLGNGGYSAASGIASAIGVETTTQKYSAAICTTPMTNVHEVELIFSDTNGGAITSAWVLSSTNGTTWEVESRKVFNIVTGTKFVFEKNNDSRQYAFVAYWNLTNSGGLKGFGLKLYGDYPNVQTITASADSVYSDQTITLTTNATSAAWTITANTAGASLSADNAKSTVVSATQAGSVTVQAVADGYENASKTISFTPRPSDPVINPDKTATTGYTGQEAELINFTYSSLNGSLGVSVSNGNASASIQDNDGEGHAKVCISFIHDGSSEVYLKDGSTTLATITVTILESTVSISGLPSADAICVGETLDLGSTITVTPTGSCSADVIWESEDNDVAEVSDAGIVTAKTTGVVDITVTSYAYPSATMTCKVTITESAFIKVSKFQDGRKYLIAAQGSSDANKLFYLPAASAEKASNPTAVEITTFADLTEANAWTASVDASNHIVFSNQVDETTYYLTATNTSTGIAVTTTNSGYWSFDGTGLRYNDGGTRYMASYKDGSFRYYTSPLNSDQSMANVFYRYSPTGSGKENIENLKTGSSLAYTNYTNNGNGTFSYENLGIRFGGRINKDLWADLDAEAGIEGYGVILSTVESAGSDEISSYYDVFKEPGNTVDENLAEFCDGTNFINYSNANTIHEPALKSVPTLVGDDYVWNLYKDVPENALTTVYVAVAYIKIDGDIVFLQEERASAQSLASDLINTSHTYEEDAFGGSLNYLATRS